MAHREQLRVYRGGDSHEKPNIRVVRRQPGADKDKDSSQEFFGFPEDEVQKEKRYVRKRKCTEKVEHTPELAPRRSKRQRTDKRNDDFVYAK
ncbi:AAEL001186-PA [Aedes aegypti]|uniref:AAEL001186-PA n=1 Tax=Aedes aegypti TaxID=7159 RepID=Q17M18_AEDAE|nr:AAEL001186-PA [Aedes aegypti]